MLYFLISLYPINQTCKILQKNTSSGLKESIKETTKTTQPTFIENWFGIKAPEINKGSGLTDELVHWCTYWLIYAIFMQYDNLLLYIPLWGFISPFVLIMLYNTAHTEYIIKRIQNLMSNRENLLDATISCVEESGYLSKLRDYVITYFRTTTNA